MAKPKKEEKTEEKTEAAEFKFGVSDLAEAMGIKPASVRVQLRNKGIEKAGKSYGWNTKSELKEVMSQLKAGSDDDEEEEEKPSKKSSKKKVEEKPVKKARSKKAADEDEEDE